VHARWSAGLVHATIAQMRENRRWQVPSVVVLGVLALTGCGSSSSSSASKTGTSPPTSTVNKAAVEQGIENSLSTSSVKVSSASCPSNIPSKVGQTFTCSVKLSNGGTGDAVVTQAGPNSFTYELKNGTVQIPGSTADAAIKKQLAAQGAPNAVVNCPSTIIVKVGTSVTCAVSSANGKAHGSVTFTFSGADGTVDPSSVKQTA
jgi:Domain of unknown function (DUF4333)